MGEDPPEPADGPDPEVLEVGERAPRAPLGEERAKAADGQVAVGGEDGVEVGLVAELGEVTGHGDGAGGCDFGLWEEGR